MSQPPMFGAVDLSSLAPKNSDETPARSVGGQIVDSVTMSGLEALVEASTTVPYILLFHSDRSEHSVELKTFLTTAITERGGDLGLRIVDIDEDRDIAMAFRIQAVPTTVGLIGGNPTPLFQGRPGDADITEVLTKVRAAAEEMGVRGRIDATAPAPEAPQLPPHIAEAREALAAGDLKGAEEEFTKALKENPGEDSAKTGLAQIELLKRVQSLDPQQALTTAGSDNGVEAQLAAADVEVAAGRPESAFARILHFMASANAEDREKARVRILELFTVLGHQDPVVAEARKQLASVLL